MDMTSNTTVGDDVFTNPNSVDTHVGARVRSLRILRNMTQTDLADRLDLSFQQLQKYETGANRVSASKLYLIAKVLGVEAAYFFEGLESTEDPDAFDFDTETARIAAQIARIPNTEMKACLREMAKLMAEKAESTLSSDDKTD